MAISWQKTKFWFYLVLVSLVVRAAFFYDHLHSPLLLGQDLLYQVKDGSSLIQVAADLERRGILTHAADLVLFARMTQQADSIRVGEYQLEVGMNPLRLLGKLVRGEVKYHQLVLLEGWTAFQALKAIQKNEYIVTTLDAENNDELQAELGLTIHPEGLFFPDTYNFSRGTTDREILYQARVLMTEILAREWMARDSGLPYENSYEALIMASIIEKETALRAEQGKIAGVFIRRLQAGMRLQTDPTIIYGLGAAFTGNLTRTNLLQNTPYNTYMNKGLPPTPIALPGRDAIVASLHPDQGEALYFVARGDGSHHFSVTLEEHNDAVRRYQIDRRLENDPALPVPEN
ncbi:MAG: endolytic transglycosylase MltG [Pseudomonadales bacterium]|nr:endolytic transglycosylase MltG [Pseudomonadales bacterium]